MANKWIPLESITFDLENPRYDGLTDQRHALQKIIEDQNSKLLKLAADIVQHGTSPAELTCVIPGDTRGKYVAVEGNRRLAATKLLCNPARLDDVVAPDSFKKSLKRLATSFDRSTVDRVHCVVFDSREDARHWIELRHTGLNKGAGIDEWDGQMRARFRGGSPSLGVLEFLKARSDLVPGITELLDDVPITNLDRLIGDPDAREALGLQRKDGQLVSIVALDALVKSLGKVVKDLASGDVTVTDIKRKDDRTRYLDSIRDSLPSHSNDRVEPYALTSEAAPTKSKSAQRPSATRQRSAATSTNRSSLIPRSCVMVIEEPRVDAIYKELRKLSVDDFPNAAAVLSRVFLETSLSVAFKAFALSGIKDELKPRLDAVANHLQGLGVPKNDLKAIRLSASQQSSPFAVDLLHSYVHNENMSPDPDTLKRAWDTVQPFFVALWAQIKIAKRGPNT